MGDRKTCTVLGLLLILAIIPLISGDAFALDYKKHVTAEDLGVLQLAAHDLFNVARGDGETKESATEFEDGKLNLSTLFVDTANSNTPFSDDIVAIGGEHRNRENIMLFTVASYFGEKYNEHVANGINSADAKNLVVQEYHDKLADSYKKAFGEEFPGEGDFINPLEDRFQQNLALRTIHDFLPGKIKFDNRFVSTLDPDLRLEKLNEKDLKQKSSKLDGKFDKEFLDINICLDPPECTFIIVANLLEADRSFGTQFETEESFDDFLEQLEDGLYDEEDSVLDHIRTLMARGQNFSDYT
jgi:hypothetical protein